MPNTIPNKERMKLPRQHMPECEPHVRAHNFEEVTLGFNPDLANAEALRCLTCAKPTCTKGCPVGVDVKQFVAKIIEGDYLGAAAVIRKDNALPAITGRVCPQEEQCEGDCLMAKRVDSLAIGHLERFVADYERFVGRVGIPEIAPPTGRKVGIVGSGPAGLSCAGDLIQKGHEVRVFEALHELGGVLVYGIPEFRLPKDIVRQEVDVLRLMGVAFETNVVVGKTVTLDELFDEEGYDAVFVATGAGLPQFLGVPGEHLNGVYSANEFLTRVNLMRAYRFPEFDEPVYDCRDRDVVVVGGGNTAMDAVRTALRLGARNATLVYRRSEAEMPARKEEVKHAKEEGVDFRTLTNPVELIGDAQGWLTGVRVTNMELGEADDSGRRRPVPVAGSEHVIPERKSDRAIDDTGSEDDPQELHRSRSRNVAHIETRSLRGRRHRHRRSDRDSRDGRWAQGRCGNPRLPDDRGVVLNITRFDGVFATGHARFRFDRALEVMHEALESAATSVESVLIVLKQ